MASSNSQHTHPPGSCSFAGNTPPPVGNNPPELQPHGSNVNRKKRLTNGQLATGNSTPSKRRQTERSTGKEIEDQTAINTASRRQKEEVDILNDVLDFCRKTQTYPDTDIDNLLKFYLQWVQRRVNVYADEFEVSTKIDELNFRFFMNMGKKLNGEDVERAMDRNEVEIFQLSNLIWGLQDHHGGTEASSSRANQVGYSSSSAQNLEHV